MEKKEEQVSIKRELVSINVLNTNQANIHLSGNFLWICLNLLTTFEPRMLPKTDVIPIQVKSIKRLFHEKLRQPSVT